MTLLANLYIATTTVHLQYAVAPGQVQTLDLLQVCGFLGVM